MINRKENQAIMQNLAYDCGFKDGSNAGYKLAKEDTAKKFEKFFDGLTDILDQDAIDTIETLYSSELKFLRDE